MAEIQLKLSAMKVAELSTMLGRSLMSRYKADFFLSFTRSNVFLYTYDDAINEVKLLFELETAFFELYQVARTATIKVDAVKDFYQIIEKNSYKTQELWMQVVLDETFVEDDACDKELKIVNIYECFEVSQVVHFIEVVPPLHIDTYIHKKVEQNRIMLFKCVTNSVEMLETVRNHTMYMRLTDTCLEIKKDSPYSPETITVSKNRFKQLEVESFNWILGSYTAIVINGRATSQAFFAANKLLLLEMSCFVSPKPVEGELGVYLVGRGLDKTMLHWHAGGVWRERTGYELSTAASNKSRLFEEDEPSTRRSIVLFDEEKRQLDKRPPSDV